MKCEMCAAEAKVFADVSVMYKDGKAERVSHLPMKPFCWAHAVELKLVSEAARVRYDREV